MDAKIRIVLVEDSEVDAGLIVRELSRAGLDVAVHRVATEAEFLKVLRQERPHLILSDFTVPGFDGLRALELARADVPHIPFLFVSGTIGEERAVEALREGAVDYVFKSSLKRLPAAVGRALREAADERARCEQEARLARLNRSYRMLSSTGSVVLRSKNRRELLKELCEIVVEQGGHDRVVISLLSDGRVLRPRALAGSDPQLLRAVDQAVLDAPGEVAPGKAAQGDAIGVKVARVDGRGEMPGVLEHVIRNGEAVVLNDLTREGAWPTHRDVLLAHGYRAFAALPLKIGGTPIGVVTLASRQPRIFDEEEVAILEELTANVSFALQSLEKDETVHFLSHFDPLTGLGKRALFCQRLKEAMASGAVQAQAGGAAGAQAGESGARAGEAAEARGGEAVQVQADGAKRAPCAVLVFDLQKLGHVNESLGHEAGDRLIEEVAARLKRLVVKPQSLGHLGGGTFAVALCEAGAEALKGFEERLKQIFVEPFSIVGEQIRVSMRAGVARHPDDADGAEELMQAAEAALDEARKEHERSVLYSRRRQRPASGSLALEGRLAGALERGELFLHYQPKLEITSGRVAGLEALLRWRDAEQGVVSPGVFIPWLEQSGAIIEVGEWVMHQAMRERTLWFELAPLPVAVNVSPLQLRQGDFVERVLRIAERGGGGLDLEITESLLMQDIEASVEKLGALRKAGVRIAIDDFGTGYSSLRLMSRLPVDALKIDGSFVQGLTSGGPGGFTLVSTIVSLAHVFEMRTVAEGVESAEQLKLLKRMGCDEAQGFRLARPMPGEEVPAALERLAHRAASVAAKRADGRMEREGARQQERAGSGVSRGGRSAGSR